MMKNLVVDNGKECRGVNAMYLTYFAYRLFAYTHLQTETADDLDGVFLMRHQVANLVCGLVHIRNFANSLQNYKKNAT